MVKLYAEVLRNVGFRDDNWKPLASNDPAVAVVGWTKDGSVNAESDGDIVTINSTTATDGLGKSGLSISIATYPKLVVRAKANAARNFDIVVNNGPSEQVFTMALTTDYQTFTFTITLSGSVQIMKFRNQSSAGNNLVDYIAQCGLAPLQISQKDLVHCKNVRISYGADVLNFRLNNRNGKYVVSGQNPVGFGDHIRVWAGSTALHRMFGGYVEWRNPERNPSDEIWFQARGWGVALHQILVLREYNNSSPRTIINSIIDNDVNAAGTGYQITRSYVRNLASLLNVTYKAFELKPAWECFREISDLMIAHGADIPSMFVDASENLHVVPMSPSPLWSTDPFPASYPTTLSLATNQILNAFQKDVSNLCNRLHGFAVAQSPGDGDDWTENGTFSSTWGSERKQVGDTITLSAETGTVKIGAKSVKALYDNADGSGSFEGAVFYPSGANLALDVASMGTKKAPPLFDVYWRIVSQNNVAGSTLNKPTNVFFATDASNRFEYNLTADNGGTYSERRSILNTIGVAALTTGVWYHVTLPIGPFASEFVQTPNVGSPSWSNINYMGIYYQAFIGGTPPSNATFLIDGMRILGGRYRMAFDNRASPPRYPDRRERVIFDPISKDETTIKNLLKAELLRLRDPVLRGTVTVPILGDLIPEQTLTVNAASADLTNAKLRATRVIHNLSQRGFITEIELSDDYTNAQTLERFRLANALLKTGHPGVKDREIYDLRLAQLDPTFTRVDDAYT